MVMKALSSLCAVHSARSGRVVYYIVWLSTIFISKPKVLCQSGESNSCRVFLFYLYMLCYFYVIYCIELNGRSLLAADI